MAGTYSRMLSKDHTLPVSFPPGGSATVTNNGPGTVYYGHTAQTSATMNQGTLASGASVTTSINSWLSTPTLASVSVLTLDPITAGATPIATTAAGFALQNATPTILSGITPNDGQLHVVEAMFTLVVATAETGGQVSLNFTSGGNAKSVVVAAAAQAAGTYMAGQSASNVGVAAMADPGTAVTLTQTSALSAGAATIYAALLIR